MHISTISKQKFLLRCHLFILSVNKQMTVLLDIFSILGKDKRFDKPIHMIYVYIVNTTDTIMIKITQRRLTSDRLYKSTTLLRCKRFMTRIEFLAFFFIGAS